MQSHVYSVISIHHWEETKGMEVTEWTFMLLFVSVVDDSYAAFEWRAKGGHRAKYFYKCKVFHENAIEDEGEGEKGNQFVEIRRSVIDMRI